MDEVRIVLPSPLCEACLQVLSQARLQLLGHLLEVVDQRLYLLAERLASVKVTIELKLVHFGNLDRLITRFDLNLLGLGLLARCTVSSRSAIVELVHAFKHSECGSPPLVSTTSKLVVVLSLFKSLLLDDRLTLSLCYLLAHLFKVLTLEHHCLNLLDLKIQSLVDIVLLLASFFGQLYLSFGLTLEFFVIFDAFPDQEVNIDLRLLD